MDIIKNENVEYKYSEILTLNLNNKLKVKEINLDSKLSKLLPCEDICNIQSQKPLEDENIKIEVKKKYLDKLVEDSKDWSLTDEQYDKKMLDINTLKEEILILENKMLNLDNDIHQPNVDIKINGINIEDISFKDIFNINKIDFKEKDKKIIDTIKNMKENIEIYNKKIKESINHTINDNYFKFTLISNLNKIEAMIKLFEKNYNDVLKNIN